MAYTFVDKQQRRKKENAIAADNTRQCSSHDASDTWDTADTTNEHDRNGQHNSPTMRDGCQIFAIVIAVYILAPTNTI